MVDFDFYKNSYGGFIIPENKFPFYEKKAAAYVDSVTFGRLAGDNISADVLRDAKFAVCEAAECYFRVSDGSGGASSAAASYSGIKSERIGDYSVTYSGSSSSSSSSSVSAKIESDLKASVKFWLGNSGLLYRGTDE